DVIRIELPALRDRPMDIAPLARHFLALHAGPNHSDADGFTDEAMAELERYTWPGNVRELENVVQSVLVLREEGFIDRDDVRWKLSQRGAVPPARSGAGGGPPVIELPESGLVLKDTLDRLERDLIREALCRANGNRSRAANLLGLNRTTLVEKLRRRPITGDFTEEAYEAASLGGDA
ncbi:MAG: hypothetical protein KC635_28525, partial [Myxococcales bacterium]|nr:hypothetical protein [Myxococcales bacterium]